jgi:hypothetical protein
VKSADLQNKKTREGCRRRFSANMSSSWDFSSFENSPKTFNFNDRPNDGNLIVFRDLPAPGKCCSSGNVRHANAEGGSVFLFFFFFPFFPFSL